MIELAAYAALGAFVGFYVYRSADELAGVLFWIQAGWWLISNIMHAALHPHRQFYAICHAIIAVSYTLLWARTQLTPLLAMALLFLCSLGIDAWFYQQTYDDQPAKWWCDFWLNRLYEAQLATIGLTAMRSRDAQSQH